MTTRSQSTKTRKTPAEHLRETVATVTPPATDSAPAKGPRWNGRPIKQPRTSSAPIPHWQCAECGARNEMDEDLCQEPDCNGARPPGETTMTFGETECQPAGNWWLNAHDQIVWLCGCPLLRPEGRQRGANVMRCPRCDMTRPSAAEMPAELARHPKAKGIWFAPPTTPAPPAAAPADNLCDHPIHDLANVPRRPILPAEAKRRAKAAAKAAAVPAAAPIDEPPAPQPGDRFELLPIDRIARSPDNPRKHFDPDGIRELVESIGRVGVLQPLLVRSEFGGSHELVAGERRLYAAEEAKLSHVPCVIRAMTDREVLLARLEENFKRRDLNAIEEAQAFRAATTTGGFSQTELAAGLGVTQSHISHRLRLLELPDWAQSQLMTGVMTIDRGRELVAYAKYPRVMEAIWKVLKAEKEPLDNTEWKELLNDVLDNNVSRSMDTHGSSGRIFKTTPEILSQLDVVKVTKSWGATFERALNCELWDKLQQAESDRLAAKQDKINARAAKANAKTAGNSGPGSFGRGPDAPQGKSAAEIQASRKRQAEIFQKRLYKYRVGWIQQQIVARIDQADAGLILKCVLYYCCQDSEGKRSHELAEAIDKTAGKKVKRDKYARVDAWKTLTACKLSELPAIARAAVGRWVQHSAEEWGSDNTPAQLEALAVEIGVDVKRDWTLSKEFLELHTTAQLLELAREWKVAGYLSDGKKRSELITLLTACKSAPCPRELLTVKPCSIRCGRL